MTITLNSNNLSINNNAIAPSSTSNDSVDSSSVTFVNLDPVTNILELQSDQPNNYFISTNNSSISKNIGFPSISSEDLTSENRIVNVDNLGNLTFTKYGFVSDDFICIQSSGGVDANNAMNLNTNTVAHIGSNSSYSGNTITLGEGIWELKSIWSTTNNNSYTDVSFYNQTDGEYLNSMLRVTTVNSGSGDITGGSLLTDIINIPKNKTKTLDIRVNGSLNSMTPDSDMSYICARRMCTISNFYFEIVYDMLYIYLDAGIKTSYAGSGSTWNDLSDNGFSYTIVSTTFYEDPTFYVYPSISFNGTSSYLSIGSPISSGSSFSLQLWIRRNTTTGNRTIFDDGNGFYMSFSGNTLTASFGSVSTNQTVSISALFFNVTYVYDVIGDTGYLYVKDSTTTTVTSVNGLGSYTSNIMYIGKTSLNADYFNGYMSVVLVYSKALLSTDIDYNFNSHVSRYINNM